MINSVRQLALNTIRSRLGEITIDNGYTRDVSSERVFTYKDAPASMPTPCIILMQGDETIEREYSRLYECKLELFIGFVDSYSGIDPEVEGVEFMTDIQKAMGIEYVIQSQEYNSREAVGVTVQLKEIGNMINVSEALPGLVVGQVVYNIRYRRRIEDPTAV
jgi:hypothetical protein